MKHKSPYASGLGIPYVVLIAEEEANNGTVSVKNMDEGRQVTVSLNEAIGMIAR